MNLPERAVIVKELPRDCNGVHGRRFLCELVHAMAKEVRPAVVLDCSRAHRIDRSALQLFLCCLEEAMKRNGDVRLARVHQDAWPVLESAGIGHLFRRFETAAEAVLSYRRPTFARPNLAADEAETNVA